MAAVKPEVLIFQQLDKMATPFQRLAPFSGSRNSMGLFRILPDVTGSRKFKMAAIKPEALISQLLDKIATPFQRLQTFSGPSNSMALLVILPDVTGSRKSKMAEREVLISQLLV